MADKKKCAWYAEFEGVCTNGDCPYCADDCPISGELGVCRFAKDNHVPSKVKGVEIDPVREKLIEVLRGYRADPPCDTCEKPIGECDRCGLDRLVDHMIANDVTVQKRGWIKVYSDAFYPYSCSECGNCHDRKAGFCSNCGTKLDLPEPPKEEHNDD